MGCVDKAKGNCKVIYLSRLENKAMSVITTLDEYIETAVESIDKAVKDLNYIIVNDVWGYEDCTDDYKDTLQESIIELIKIKRKIK